jgi:UDP-glucuronate 4-epimerase
MSDRIRATYFVTGAAGFIGASVSRILLKQGHRVFGIDNLNDAYDVRLKRWRLKQLRVQKDFYFETMDILKRSAMDQLLGRVKPVAIINLAARAGVRQSVQDPWIYIDTNVTGTLNLLDLCVKHGIKKFVQASTSSLYGIQEQPCTEDLPTGRPLSPYAASKKASEALCHSYYHLHGLDISVLRYFTVYGPAGRPDMSPMRFTKWIFEKEPVRIFGDGKQSRDFTFVDDIARGTILALRPLGFEIINLGSNHPVRLLDTIQILEKRIGKEALIQLEDPQPADVATTWADISKAANLLDWQPMISVESGLEELVDWYRKNREWACDLKL